MRKGLVFFVAALFVFPALVFAGADDEVSYKAEFIIDLIDNIELSDDSKLSDAEEILIYVVGESPVQARLEELAGKLADNGRKISVENVSYTDDLGACDILFLPSHELSDLAKVLKKLNGKRTVTVADSKDFARYGAMINFYEDEKESEVHYEVNQLVLDSAGIHLSSKVLDKAELI